jgi:hypothetical protein
MIGQSGICAGISTAGTIPIRDGLRRRCLARNDHLVNPGSSLKERGMSAELLSTIAGAILSLLFSYVPGLSSWYQKLGEGGDGVDGGTARRLIMLGLLVLTAASAYGLACSGWGAAFGFALDCDRRGIVGLVQGLVLAVMANQSTYNLTPRK